MGNSQEMTRVDAVRNIQPIKKRQTAIQTDKKTDRLTWYRQETDKKIVGGNPF